MRTIFVFFLLLSALSAQSNSVLLCDSQLPRHCAQIVLGGGGTPFTFSTDASIPHLTLSALTGLTQCLQVSTTGVISGTGAACGSAGGVSSVTGSSPITASPTTGAVTISCSTCLTTTGGWTASGINIFTGNTQWTDGVNTYIIGLNLGHLIISKGGIGNILDMTASLGFGQLKLDFLDVGNINGTAMTLSGNLTNTGNLYMRTFAGTPSCTGVANGWIGFDTSAGTLWVCNGGVATAH